MPKLLIFAPCERVAFGSHDNSVTMVAVIQGFTADKVPAEDASLPLQWSIFSLWRSEPDEINRDYVESVDLVAPSGNTVASSSLSFTMTKDFQRNIIHLTQFPIGESGDYVLKMHLDETAGPRVVAEATYPIRVSHPSIKEPTVEAAT